MELTASADFGKQNPKQNIILLNSTSHNLSIDVQFVGGFLENSACKKFFSRAHSQKFGVTLSEAKRERGQKKEELTGSEEDRKRERARAGEGGETVLNMFRTEMFSNGGRRILVLVYALMQMPPCVTLINCIAHVTFKLINKGFLVNNRRLDFARFWMLFDLVTKKRGLDSHLNFLAQIFELCPYNIG